MGNPATLPADFFTTQQRPNPAPPSPEQPAGNPDTLPANFFSQQQTAPQPQAAPGPNPDTLPADFFSHPQPAAQPKPNPEAGKGVVGKSWDWLNKPLVDLTREGAGPIESGFENFASGLTSPLSVGLLVATLGGSLAEQGLVGAGLATAREAAAATRVLKLSTDVAFLSKYGYDLGTRTMPELEMNWGDYRAATNERDRTKALNRFEQLATESVLNAVATGFATRGVGHQVEAIERASAKGQALSNEQYAGGVYDYQQENQLGTAQSHQDFERFNRKGSPVTRNPDYIPPERQVAISRNIEAGGDPTVLEAQAKAAEANPATKETAHEYRDAMRLSDSEIQARDYLQNVLAGDLAHLKHLGLLPQDGGLTNYLPHKWDVEDVDPETGKTLERTLVDGDRDMLKKRTFATMAEGEQKGAKPTTKSAVALISDYHERVSNLIAKHNLAEKLASSYMNDGAPVAAPGHMFPGFTRPRDAPLSPEEVLSLKAAGKFDDLLAKGRIYEVEPKPAKVTPSKETALATRPTNELPAGPEAKPIESAEDLEDRAFMWKQRDYVPSGLSVWRPVSEAEARELPNAVTVFGDGPVPPEAIMEPGMRGIPTDQPQRIAKARVPVYVHPDVAPHLEPMLETTRPKNALIRAFLAVTKETKSDLLSLSPFHWATILNRTLEAGMNPFRGENRKFIFAPKDIDYYNLSDNQMKAIHDGVVVSSTRPGFSGYLAEGLGSEHDSLINKIPLIGDFNRAIEDRLFGPHGWISSLKFDLYGKLKGELQKSKPQLSEEQAGRIAAAQVNNKFGGLNYTVLGRGASTQNTLRALLLAPDFLESSGRSILDVAGDHGTALVKSLVAFNAAQWLLVRGINYLVSGNTHPESNQAVLSKNGKREYTMRTTLGDFLRFAQKPREFLSNRVNPIGVRAPAEIVAGEDPMGNKVTTWQQFFDTLRQVTPIPLQGLIPENRISQPSPTDKLLQSVGVGSRKKFSPAETLAHELQTKRNGEGAPLEGDELARAQLRYKLEDQLRTAINGRDSQGRADAIKQIHGASVGPDAKLTGEEASKLIAQAHKYPMPLQSAVEHLALADALQVWDKASINERHALRPIIQKKIERWQMSSSERTRKQNDAMRQQIQAFRFSLAQ